MYQMRGTNVSMVLEKAEKVNLRDRDSRKRLAKTLTNLFDKWAIPVADQQVLLGFSPESRSTVNRYREGQPFADNRDLIGRAGHLLGIHKSLRVIFPHDRDLVYRWVTTPNRRFDNRTPLDIMKSGYEGVLAVRRYLDFERGR